MLYWYHIYVWRLFFPRAIRSWEPWQLHTSVYVHTLIIYVHINTPMDHTVYTYEYIHIYMYMCTYRSLHRQNCLIPLESLGTLWGEESSAGNFYYNWLCMICSPKWELQPYTALAYVYNCALQAVSHRSNPIHKGKYYYEGRRYSM